ncbi:hypothetical protein IFM89_023840 [Coptis chinensis]|uniref:60S ribosomal protein L7a n=1 Tax=Coptis chinensis TaxID=261450 RepID=A0A835IY41_9MAGN|nr:hypothetical protein IFM89_023840 [Coptis chinensis]
MAPKRGAKAPAPAKKKAVVTNPLFEKRAKRFGIGGALPPKKDLHRFVKWPKVVRIQRQQRILKQRLKVPLALNQFTKTLDKNLALRMELDIQSFMQNHDQQQFEFQHFPTSYLRLAAHRVAQHYGLQSMQFEFHHFPTSYLWFAARRVAQHYGLQSMVVDNFVDGLRARIVRERSLTVIAYSENNISLLDLDTQVFSDSLLSLDVRLLFTSASGASLVAASREILLVNPIWVHSRNTQKPFYAILHRIDVGIVVDFEPARSGDPAFTIVGVVQSQKLARSRIWIKTSSQIYKSSFSFDAISCNLFQKADDLVLVEMVGRGFMPRRFTFNRVVMPDGQFRT